MSTIFGAVATVVVAGTLVLLARQRARPDSYGASLAGAVAGRLETGCQLSYAHREYCGMGLRFVEPHYVYGEVWDGRLPSPLELDEESAETQERMVFPSRQAFVAWLAGQSDRSMSGESLESEWLRGNQRLTRTRLTSFAKGEPVPAQ